MQLCCMKTKILFLVLSISLSSLFAQNNADFILKFKNANDVYKAANYFQALPLYLELYKTDTTNANLNF